MSNARANIAASAQNARSNQTPAAPSTSLALPGGGIIRVRELRCGCGRFFMANDADTDAEGGFTLTCGNCHRRPIEFEPRGGA